MLLVSFNVHTCVPVGDQEYFIPRATIGCPQKAQPTAANLEPSPCPQTLSLAAAVAAAVAVVSQVSFHFPSLVTGNNLNLSERAEGACRQWQCRAGDQLECVKQVRKSKKKRKYLFAKAVDHVLVMSLKDWIECSLHLN